MVIPPHAMRATGRVEVAACVEGVLQPGHGALHRPSRRLGALLPLCARRRRRRGARRSRPIKMILRTLGDICADIEDGARDHWHEEVHARGRQGDRAAAHRGGLREAARGRPGLSAARAPSTAATACRSCSTAPTSRWSSRADSSLMTIVGLQAGVADDIEKYGSDEIKQRYLPRFASGEYPGLHGPHRAAGRLRSRRHHHPRDARRATATSSTARRSSSPTAAPTCTWCWRATRRPSTSRRARPTA